MISMGWHCRHGLFVLLAISLTAMACAPIGPIQKAAATLANSTNITLSRDLSGTLAQARTSGKPTVLMFSAVWCPHCEALEANVLTSPDVQVLGDDFYWVLVNIDRQASIARNYHVDVVPQILLLDADGRLWKRIINVVTAQQLRQYLTEFVGNLERSSGVTSLQSQAVSGRSCQLIASRDHVSKGVASSRAAQANVCTVN